MRSFDFFLLDRFFNPFSKKFHMLTGKNCFYLAKASFIASAVITAINGICIFITLRQPFLDGVLMILIFFVNSQLFIMSGDLAKNEQKKHEKGNKGLIYPSRTKEQPLRIILILVVPYIFFMTSFMDSAGRGIFVIIGGALIGFELALYFLACTPPPPLKSENGASCVTHSHGFTKIKA